MFDGVIKGWHYFNELNGGEGWSVYRNRVWEKGGEGGHLTWGNKQPLHTMGT